MKQEYNKHKEITKRLERFHKNGDSITLKATLKDKNHSFDSNQAKILTLV